MQPRLIGIRHHSPACARLVAQVIATDRPAAVLIEGPADLNPRLQELLLPHQLPIALYSYSHDGAVARQCWFPFVSHSPEWVALTQGQASGAEVRFIDLPHWHYRTLSDQERRQLVTAGHQIRFSPGRYTQVNQALAERTHCDGQHALWDHLFEAHPLASADDFAELEARLGVYFHDLRGDPAQHGSPQDAAREQYMARWLAWAVARFAGRPVLLVCGGWHKRALEALWPSLAVAEEPPSPTADDPLASGAYLVPYESAQLEALSGYAAGLPSPRYYQWLAEDGQTAAAERAARAIIERLRGRNIPVSTADCVAFYETLHGLARLRGHSAPLRSDVLDAVQATFIKEALDAPPPWSRDGLLTPEDHPILREALLALTGLDRGALATDTPLPPLLADVERCLAASAIVLTTESQTRIVDRRRPEDTTVAETLWRLQLIGADGIQLKALRAPQAARGLSSMLAFEEHWQLVQTYHWLPSLIEAAAYGGTLATAARACLLQRLRGGRSAQEIADCFIDAVRAGFHDLGDELVALLRQCIGTTHHHGALAGATLALLDLALAGFWGQAVFPLMQGALILLGERLLWLLDCLDPPPVPVGTLAAAPPITAESACEADVAAVRALAGLLRLQQHQAMLAFDEAFLLDCLVRFARSPGKPAALRGAAAGLAQSLQHRYAPGSGLAEGELIRLTRAIPPRSQLGDYLYGLFALTRASLNDQPALINALHATLSQLGDEDFLVALPALRAAFSWFTPRERGDIASRLAPHLGLANAETNRLTQLPQGSERYLAARRTEALALQWAEEYRLTEF